MFFYEKRSQWITNLKSSLMPYNRKSNVLSVSLNKTFPSFLQVTHASDGQEPQKSWLLKTKIIYFILCLNKYSNQSFS